VSTSTAIDSVLPSARPWVVALVLGLILGLTGLLLEHAPDPLSRLSALGGPWLVVAFVVGAIVGRPLVGALAGSGALVVATIAYYLAKPIIGSPINPPQYDTPLFWLAVAVPAGLFAGAMGAYSVSARRWLAVAAAALTAAVVIAESALRNLDTTMLIVGGTLAALLLPVFFLPSWRMRAAGALLAVGLAVPVAVVAEAIGPLIITLR
jgi:hypothetical protein